MGLRGGNVCPLRWNRTDHLSGRTIRGLVRSEDEFQGLEDLVCRPNSQLKSNEVVRPGKRIGRVGADDDGNLCVVRRSE